MRPAGHHYTREELAALKRADLQKLCKDYGVRANMKTEALIEFLLESINSNMAPLIQQRAPIPRRVSTRSSSRVSSLRSRGASGSSTSTNFQNASVQPMATSSPRNNKAKATQYRLGVGRPSTVGSLGGRTSTRSSSLARSARGKNSRSLRPQETIEEEPSQPEPSQPEAGPSTCNSPQPPCKSEPSNIETRLNLLESLVRDSDMKQHVESYKDLPSQVAWLKASIQQREAEIIGLRGELNVCKAECLELRGAVSRIPLLEGQLKMMRESIDNLLSTISSNGKDKLQRRVSIPLGDSDTNTQPVVKTSSNYVLPLPSSSLGNQNQNNTKNTISGPSVTALGKRPREADVSETMIPDPKERNGMTEEEYARRNGRFERKRPKAERLPLQEKVMPVRREAERAASEQDSGEEYAPSAGTSASVPTNPSVVTPPHATIPQYFGDLIIQSDSSQSDQPGIIDFYQAASSTPRDDIFNFLDEPEPFTPGSALKAREVPAQPSNQLSNNADAQRRISTNIPRPRTPTRVTGHQRFRHILYDAGSPVQEPIQSPFNPYEGGVYTIPFEPSAREARNQERRSEPQEQPVVQTSIPIALGVGLATGAVETPHHEGPRTLYGTEMNSTGRFGDFGRLGPLPHNFWTGY